MNQSHMQKQAADRKVQYKGLRKEGKFRSNWTQYASSSMSAFKSQSFMIYCTRILSSSTRQK
jgi:hypothetical protein